VTVAVSCMTLNLTVAGIVVRTASLTQKNRNIQISPHRQEYQHRYEMWKKQN
jgi:hypothetical protein